MRAVHTLLCLNLAYEDSQISAVINGRKTEFLLVQMTPSNWYQWFDQQQPSDGEWTEVYIIMPSCKNKVQIMQLTSQFDFLTALLEYLYLEGSRLDFDP